MDDAGQRVTDHGAVGDPDQPIRHGEGLVPAAHRHQDGGQAAQGQHVVRLSFEGFAIGPDRPLAMIPPSRSRTPGRAGLSRSSDPGRP